MFEASKKQRYLVQEKIGNPIREEKTMELPVNNPKRIYLIGNQVKEKTVKTNIKTLKRYICFVIKGKKNIPITHKITLFGLF